MGKKDLKPKPRGFERSLQRILGSNPTRVLIQAAFLALTLWIGWEFHDFVEFHRSTPLAGIAARADTAVRPPGVEGFLPISGLMGIRDWFNSGSLNTFHPAATVLVILFVAMSWLLRKAFCSWICPVGALSEYLWKAGRFMFGRTLTPWKWLDIPLRSIKYLLMAFFVYAVFWSMSPGDIRAFIESPYNRVADVKMYEFFARISPFALKTLVVLALLSLLLKNFWCRYLCPYGALLGIFSRISPTSVKRDETTCIDCGKCAVACPSYLPVDKLDNVRSAECTGCLDCVAVCPVAPALQVETAIAGRTPRIALFAAAVLVSFLAGIGLARVTGHWQSSIPAVEYNERIKNLDSPIYSHPGRGVSADSAP